MKKFLAMFLKYVKFKRSSILMFLIVFSIYALISYLYSFSVDGVIYAALLSSVALFLAMLFGFYRFYVKCRELDAIIAKSNYSIESFPEAKDEIEIKYQAIIKTLDENRMKSIYEKDRLLTDMQDYYTLWTHQIKNPISAARLIVQTSENEINEELDLQLLKIDQYVDMALQYLRSESISSDLTLRKIDLDALIKKSIKKVAKQFIRKKMDIKFTHTDMEVLSDEKWLSFVLEQIFLNSLKYASSGTVSIYMDPAADKTLVIEDNGIGIKGEDLPRVFEKGFTGYNGRLEKKSTGIGLYLCKKVLNKLSHDISIESEEGRGVKVKIDLKTEALLVE